MIAALLRDIREEVIGLLFNRYVFRTHQEIVRLNSRLQGRPQSLFSEWGQVVYAVANAVGVRRLASDTYQSGDVNLVRLLDLLIQAPRGLWNCFQQHFATDAAEAKTRVEKSGKAAPGWEELASKRLVGEDRKALINAATKANVFASKRGAHSVPTADVRTTFSDLDDAIDVVKSLTEKYTLLVSCVTISQLEPLHRAGQPTIYETLVKMQGRDLMEEMKSRKLQPGWDSIFLEVWATADTLGMPLGELGPPADRMNRSDK